MNVEPRTMSSIQRQWGATEGHRAGTCFRRLKIARRPGKWTQIMRGWEEEGQGLMLGMEVDEELMEGRGRWGGY